MEFSVKMETEKTLFSIMELEEYVQHQKWVIAESSESLEREKAKQFRSERGLARAVLSIRGLGKCMKDMEANEGGFKLSFPEKREETSMNSTSTIRMCSELERNFFEIGTLLKTQFLEMRKEQSEIKGSLAATGEKLWSAIEKIKARKLQDVSRSPLITAIGEEGQTDRMLSPQLPTSSGPFSPPPSSPAASTTTPPQSSLKGKRRSEPKATDGNDSGHYKCSSCEKTFRWKSELKLHERMHSGIKPYQCTVCERSFTWEQAYKKHLLLHRYKKTLACPNSCGDILVAKPNLSNPIRIFHQGEYQSRYDCIFCRKRFPGIIHLERHLHSHTHERPYFCSLCDRGFSQKGSLKKHMQKHQPTRKRSFKCDSCSKSFFTKGELGQHNNQIHMGVKVIKSVISNPELLPKHKQTLQSQKPNGEKTYPCSQCSKKFSSKLCQKDHIRRFHSTERPYKCSTCKNGYASYSSLWRHKKRIHQKL